MEVNTVQTIYRGPRDQQFVDCIYNVLRKGNLKEKYIRMLLSEESLIYFSHAFTSSSVDEENNYEVFEQLGDLSANKFITSYMYERFPILRCYKGVKVVARLRINYGSKQTFWRISERLGFWNFISCSSEERKYKMKPLLEDIFESFIGVTEYLLDTNFRNGVGYAIIYDILTSIFNEMHISLDYNKLYDEKTRLKELIDYFKTLGTLKYEETKEDMITTSTVSIIMDEQKKVIGTGTASLKIDAQKAAAAQGLITLKRMGYEKPISEFYSIISQYR